MSMGMSMGKPGARAADGERGKRVRVNRTSHGGTLGASTYVFMFVARTSGLSTNRACFRARSQGGSERR